MAKEGTQKVSKAGAEKEVGVVYGSEDELLDFPEEHYLFGTEQAPSPTSPEDSDQAGRASASAPGGIDPGSLQAANVTSGFERVAVSASDHPGRSALGPSRCH